MFNSSLYRSSAAHLSACCLASLITSGTNEKAANIFAVSFAQLCRLSDIVAAPRFSASEIRCAKSLSSIGLALSHGLCHFSNVSWFSCCFGAGIFGCTFLCTSAIFGGLLPCCFLYSFFFCLLFTLPRLSFSLSPVQRLLSSIQ